MSYRKRYWEAALSRAYQIIVLTDGYLEVTGTLDNLLESNFNLTSIGAKVIRAEPLSLTPRRR